MPKTIERRPSWGVNHLRLMLLAAVDFMQGKSFGASLHRIIQQVVSPKRFDILHGSSIYAQLRLMERQGLLSSSWNKNDNQNVRCYRVTPMGKQFMQQLWGEIGGMRDKTVYSKHRAAEKVIALRKKGQKKG